MRNEFHSILSCIAGVLLVSGIALAGDAAAFSFSTISDAKVGQTLDGGYVVRASSPSWVAVEREDKTTGEILFVSKDGKVTRVKKTVGTVGPHSDPPPVVHYPPEFWDKLLTAPNDFLAEQYLAKKNAANIDPTFVEIQKLFPPILYPETTVGMNSFPWAVVVSASGAVEANIGFVSGVKLGMRHICGQFDFLLNGRKPTPKEIESNITHRLLGGWLPATDYRYRMADQPIGWEQAVLMGRYQGVPGIFVRFRIVNLDAKSRTMSFAVKPPNKGSFERTPAGWNAMFPRVTGGISSWENDKKMLAAFRTMQAAAPRAVPFSTSVPGNLKDGNLTWSVNLPAGGSKDLHFFYPGPLNGKLTRLPDAEVQTAFYSALKEQYESWSDYLAKGAEITIPEPGLEDIFRAGLCKILTSAHGDEFQGGLVHYRGFWPFTHLHSVRMMIHAGLFDKARAAMAEFINNRIEPDGTFTFNSRGGRYQLFDAGEFLQAMSQYYRATGDPSLVLNCQDKINRIFRMMRDNRAENMTRFPKDDPRHGMMTSGFENDIQVQDQYYTSDCGVWVGIRDYAEVLEKIAATPQGGALAAKAKEVKHFSDDLYKSLRTSMDKAGIVRDTAGKPVAFQCSPDVKGEGLKSKYFTVLTPWVVYRRFHGQPRMFAHGFMSDAETVAFLDFQAKHDQTILGVRRWKPAVLDDFVSFEVEYQRLRLDRVREFLMKYFAYLQLQTSVGTWTGFEQTFCDTAKGVKARKPKPDSKTKLHGMNTYEGLHGTIVAPMLTEQMFCFDEPGKDAVWLGAGISTHWLKDGAPLVAKRMGCRYGLVDLAMTWRAADKTLTAEITPTPGRTMTEVRVRFRSPTGKPLTSATLADGIACEIKGDLTILHNVFKPVIVTAHFAE